MIKVPLKDISIKISSGITPLRSNPEFWETGDIPWVKTEQLGTKNIWDSNEKISKAALEKTSLKLNPVNSLSIAMYGEGRTRGSVSIFKKEVTTNQACCNIAIDASKADYEYVYYFLKTQYNELRNLSSGVRKNLNSNDIKNFEVRLPKELLTQRNISKVLSSIDDKIELNNKINAELEAMAKLIYDYWFVQFDFPNTNGKPYKSSGGKMVYNQALKREIPYSWVVKTLDQLSTKIGDGIHGTPEYVDESEFSFINGNNLKNGFIHTGKNTKKVNVKEYEKYFIKLDENSILMSINGTLGNLAVYSNEKIMLGKSSAYINCLAGHREFCYQYLQQSHVQDNFWNIATGSTIKNLSLKSLKNMSLSYSNIELILKFNEVVEPITAKRENIFKENNKLTELRDWLLPMLMNGQVTIGKTPAPVKKEAMNG